MEKFKTTDKEHIDKKRSNKKIRKNHKNNVIESSIMNPHNIFFRLNPTENIIITLNDPIEYLNPCYEEYIVLSQNNKIVRLASETIYHNMLDLIDHIKKALNNELQLHMSITQDIGYLFNKYLHDENNISDDDLTINTSPYYFSDWIGHSYYTWEGKLNELILITWIYNDKDGNIIFEVTPCYPYFFCDPEEEPHYIPYDEWIKTYEPYVIRTLSRETAQEWLEKAEFLVNTMDEYVRKWEKEQKKL